MKEKPVIRAKSAGFYVIIATLFLINAIPSLSQSGMNFKELSKKLEEYYAPELIDDIKSELPEGGGYSIWGWDVGDFSGDGYYDLAFSVKFHNDKSKKVQVFLFIDSEGFLTKVGQYQYDYFEMPLEIGVSIKDNTCYVTKKRKLFDWVIKGYRFINGDLIQLDNFETYRIDPYTYEQYRNYQTCETREKYLLTKNNEVVFQTNYITIPAYERGRMMYHGFANYVSTTFPEFVFEGAFYHKSDEDGGYSVKSNYDNENLYFTINITDDEVVPTRCDTCKGDNIELWFDFYPLITSSNRLVKEISPKKLDIRTEPDSGIYSIAVSPGDFMNIMPSVIRIKTTDSVNIDQKASANKIKIVSSLYDGGYKLKVKIPLEIFNVDLTPETDKEFTGIGFSLVVNDIDNEFRADEMSRIASSKFTPNIPVTFGEMVFVPSKAWYGESNNIYHDSILKVLEEYGF